MKGDSSRAFASGFTLGPVVRELVRFVCFPSLSSPMSPLRHFVSIFVPVVSLRILSLFPVYLADLSQLQIDIIHPSNSLSGRARLGAKYPAKPAIYVSATSLSSYSHHR